ncbi:unnamed protein product [Caretta caretta]
MAALRGHPSTATEHLHQTRRRKKRTWDGIFIEILQASAASDLEQKAWMVTIADILEKEREDWRKAPESQKSKKRKMHKDIMGFSSSKHRLLWTYRFNNHRLSALCSPLQQLLRLPPLNIPHGIRGLIPTYYSTLGDIRDNHSFTYTDL